MIRVANLTFLWDVVVNPRLGVGYDWGGSFSPDDPGVGTDCSGAVTPELTALAYGPEGVIWNRQFFTGTFAGAEPGDHGPFGGVNCTRDLICIAHPGDAPFGAAMVIAIRQMDDPTDAHMIISVPKFVGGPWTTIEMGGPPDNYHLGVTAIDASEFNQWFYLPGPIGDGSVVPQPIPVNSDNSLVAALRAKSFSPELIRLIQGFNVVEGLNPAGNPTLGWTDAQLGGDSTLQGHVDALAQQFIDREPVAGGYPQGGTDLEQAQWIAKVVGQSGSPSDWQGNPQPTDYVQRVVDAMQDFPLGEPPVIVPPPPVEDGGFLVALTPEQQQQIYDKITSIWDSRSPFRHLGEHHRDDTVGFLLNTDSNAHVPTVITLAMLGDPGSLALLQEVAGADLAQYPDRKADSALAQRVLTALQSATTPPVITPGGGGTTPPIIVGPPPPAPSPEKITLLTIGGHMADMMEGYQADLARAMDPHLFYWQPVGNWDVNALPMGPPCDAAYAEGLRLLRVVHPSGPFALASYSQGAIVASRLYMALAPGGDLANRANDFVGGVTWGNPYREQGSFVGHEPGGHGISGTRIVGTGPLWKDYVDPGDLYANVSGPSGDDCTAIYDMAMRLNPMLLMGEMLKLFTNPAPELIAMIQAIIQGITFAAGNPMTAAHVSYQWRECEPGVTYWQSAVNYMKSVGARVRN